MKESARAIIIKNGWLAVMKRSKFGQQYYTLLGGGIEAGETPEEAAKREVTEETGLEVSGAQLVFIEDNEQFGRQHIFLCEVIGDDMQVAPDAFEHTLNKAGENTYEPVWLTLDEAERVALKSEAAAKAVLNGARNGFPKSVKHI